MIKKTLLVGTMLAALAGCQSAPQSPSAPLQLVGNWKIESVMGQPTVDYSPAELNFAADGKLSGNNSCNNFFGQYSLQGDKLTLNPGGTTMKACVDALMAQEQMVNQAMPMVQTAQMNQGILELKGENGKVLLTLTKL